MKARIQALLLRLNPGFFIFYFLFLCFSISYARALTIEVSDISAGGAEPKALAAVRCAAASWEKSLSDDVTVRIEVRFVPYAPIRAATISETVDRPYAEVREALRRHACSPLDAQAVESLPSGESFPFFTNDIELPGKSIFVSGVNAPLARLLKVNRANAKALGLLADDGKTDAVMTIATNVAFDYDSSDGVEQNAIDLESLATHELGHALGFKSGVDTIDLISEPAGLAKSTFNGTKQLLAVALFYPLDLFRFSERSLVEGKRQNVVSARELRTRGAPFFSVDGGRTSLALFHNGVFNGDRGQPSHFIDDDRVGVFGTSASEGQSRKIGLADLQALDAVGWDLAETCRRRTNSAAAASSPSVPKEIK